jgi:hypothetical protein
MRKILVVGMVVCAIVTAGLADWDVFGRTGQCFPICVQAP